MHEWIDRTGFIDKYVQPYWAPEWHYDPGRGYVVWRLGTGENVELLHIRTFAPGLGYGRALFCTLLDRLSGRPPYYSIFGFTRTSNSSAQAFYGALGFHLQPIEGLYKEGSAIMFWQSYGKLLEEKCRYEDTLRGTS